MVLTPNMNRGCSENLRLKFCGLDGLIILEALSDSSKKLSRN